MKLWLLFWVEWKRLFRYRPAQISILLTIFSPIAGLFLYRPLYSISSRKYTTTVLGMYLANPALAGGMLGAVLFAVLTILEYNRVAEYRLDSFLNAIVSPLKTSAVYTLSILTIALLTQLATMTLWLPFTVYKTRSIFDMGDYIGMYSIFMFGSIVISIVFTSSMYQLFHRADVTMILFFIFAVCGLTVFKKNWLLSWITPLVWIVSDDFTNHRILMSVAYVRLFWILVSVGIWLFSYLCIREYGKDIAGAFWYHITHSVKRFCILLLSFVLLAGGAYSYWYQPFVDHSKKTVDYDAYENYKIKENVHCTSMYADVHPNTKKGTLSGIASYQIINDSGKEQTVTFYLHTGYHIQALKANGKKADFKENRDDDMNTYTVSIYLPRDKKIKLFIKFGGFPREWNIVSNSQGDYEISNQYLCLENTIIAPAPRNLIWDNDAVYLLHITLPKNMMTIKFDSDDAKVVKTKKDGSRVWELRSNNCYMILYAGNYICNTFDAAGIHVKFYYGKRHEKIMKQAKSAQSISNVIEYCTKHYGKLDSLADNSLKLIEKRCAGGGYAGYGASTLDENDYSSINLMDQNKGSIPGEVVIHETVHQWWGLGSMFDAGENDLWTSEGLTVYTTYRIVKELYGEDYAKENYVKQWQKALSEYYHNFYVRHPEYLKQLPKKYRAEIRNNLSQVRQYEEMPLKILKAEKLVGGEKKMDQILYKLFNRKMDESYSYLTYQDFLDTCGLTKEDLNLE